MAVNQLLSLLLKHILAATLLMGALQPAAARISSKAAAQHNSTFNTCNTGDENTKFCHQ